jgi:hypothetical protein
VENFEIIFQVKSIVGEKKKTEIVLKNAAGLVLKKKKILCNPHPKQRKPHIFARPLYNEQLYSLIVGSKVALLLPWEKKHSQLNLL